MDTRPLQVIPGPRAAIDLYPASQKSSPRGVQIVPDVLPSALQNSCPKISIAMVRVVICLRPEPSARMVQMRSTLCQGPSGRT